jgi:hypothetical protein
LVMADWAENLHPRAGRGSPFGGRFVSKGQLAKVAKGMGTQPGGWLLDKNDRDEIAKYEDIKPKKLKDGLGGGETEPGLPSSAW